MNKKMRALIAIGGTGGHVFPGYNLALYLQEKKYDVRLVVDKRGFKFLKHFKNIDISLLPSTPFINKNIFLKLLSAILIIYSIFRSLIFLIFNRPNIIFGMGGYASFPICFAATILNIKFIIYENNLIIGKANKLLIPFAKQIFVSSKDLEGVPKKYENKIFEIGNIIKKKIINFKNKNLENKDFKKMGILVLGGSQATKIFAELLPNIFNNCKKNGVYLKIYQHCLPSQNDALKSYYEEKNIEFEIFNFSNDILEYFSKVNLAITRSGSSVLAELTNANIPFISVPLPTSADNHQLKNALYYQKKNYSFLIEEVDLKDKLLPLIKNLSENKSLMNKIILNQRQHSDKNVYNNIDIALKWMINEKN